VIRERTEEIDGFLRLRPGRNAVRDADIFWWITHGKMTRKEVAEHYDLTLPYVSTLYQKACRDVAEANEVYKWW